MEKLAKKYVNLVKIHRGLATSIKRYRLALSDKNIDIENSRGKTRFFDQAV